MTSHRASRKVKPLLAVSLLCLPLLGCGGSSSETPYPLEPVPGKDKKAEDSELSGEEVDAQEAPAEPTGAAPAASPE